MPKSSRSGFLTKLIERAAAVGELEADDIFRVLEARKALEPRIAQLAAFRATDEDFAELQGSIDLLAAHGDDISWCEQAELLFNRIHVADRSQQLTPSHDARA